MNIEIGLVVSIFVFLVGQIWNIADRANKAGQQAQHIENITTLMHELKSDLRSTKADFQKMLTEEIKDLRDQLRSAENRISAIEKK